MLHRKVLIGVLSGMSSEACMSVLMEVVQVLMDAPLQLRICVATQVPRCSGGAPGSAHGSGHGGAHGVFYCTVCLPAAETSKNKQDTIQNIIRHMAGSLLMGAWRGNGRVHRVVARARMSVLWECW